jgi:hypothetical protein
MRLTSRSRSKPPFTIRNMLESQKMVFPKRARRSWKKRSSSSELAGTLPQPTTPRRSAAERAPAPLGTRDGGGGAAEDGERNVEETEFTGRASLVVPEARHGNLDAPLAVWRGHGLRILRIPRG